MILKPANDIGGYEFTDVGTFEHIRLQELAAKSDHRLTFAAGFWHVKDAAFIRDNKDRLEGLRVSPEALAAIRSELAAPRQAALIPPSGGIVLRDYQEFAVRKILETRHRPGNDLCILATGAGKSIVISTAGHLLNEPILVLQPSREILDQNVEKMLKYVDRSEVGIYSASAGEKSIAKFTFATIGSIYLKPELFGMFKVIFIDEAHTLDPKSIGVGGMLASFLSHVNPEKVIGFTASPFRMDTAYRWDNGELLAEATIRVITNMKPKGKNQKPFWNKILCNVTASDLIARKYLVPIEYVDRSVISQDDLKLNKSRTDFDQASAEEALSRKDAEIVDAVRWAMDRSKSVLVFTQSVKKAEDYAALIPNSAVVTAKTPAKERERIIADFKSGKVKVALNCQCLTTGFDHPELDAIVLAKPTRSIALYTQMVGRGVRTAPGKEKCLLVDLTNNVEKIGRFETIKIKQGRRGYELESETRPNWDGAFLYSYKIDLDKKNKT